MFHSWTVLHMVFGDLIFHLGSWALPLHLWQAELSNSLEHNVYTDPSKLGFKVSISDTTLQGKQIFPLI